MIIITGAYGFIGSCLLHDMRHNYDSEIVAVDDFSKINKKNNLLPFYKNITRVQRSDLFDFLSSSKVNPEVVFHLGARTDTVEQNEAIFEELNIEYSKRLWKYCSEKEVPLIYASSAATYGNGDFGFTDNHALIPRLNPMNPYGWSKQEFDLWAVSQTTKPPKWAGLKFFNVYGPNEYHKDRMASVILHAYKQIKASQKMKLFKSHMPDYADGEQSRDFIYVKDVIKVIKWFHEASADNGIYNLGTGKARSFRALTEATFNAMDMPIVIQYIDTPEDIRDTYQYYTQADMSKLINQGYSDPFISLERGIENYVQAYLMKDSYFLG